MSSIGKVLFQKATGVNMNPKKAIPIKLEACNCLCCTDCAFGDESSINQTTFVQDCDQRYKLIRERNYKLGRLGI